MQNLTSKIAIFRSCVQMFGKNAMLKLHTMLLCNHSMIMHACMASNPRKSTPKSACIMWMWATPQNEWMQAKPKTNFPRIFKTKNTRNFLKHGENRVSAVVTGGIPSETMLKLHEVYIILFGKLFFWINYDVTLGVVHSTPTGDCNLRAQRVFKNFTWSTNLEWSWLIDGTKFTKFIHLTYSEYLIS